MNKKDEKLMRGLNIIEKIVENEITDSEIIMCILNLSLMD